MECPGCKSEIPDNSQICLSCGYRILQDTNQSQDPLDILATAHHLSPGTTIANRYKLTDYIGRGGMGIVFKAMDVELDVEVAIKFLPPELAHDERSIKDLKREAKSAMLLSHPNIVRLHNFESREGLNFVIMEYINGPNLSELLTKKEYFSHLETVRLAKEICQGLSYAHKNHVVHRDIKPQNLMLHYPGKPSEFVIADPSLVIASDSEAISLGTGCVKQSRKRNLSDDWVLKIADFGIARVVSDTMSRVSQRPTTGTLVYMSPEQLRGKEIDIRTDIYSLGCVLYEFLTGRPPFHTGDIYHQHLEEPPVPPKEKNPSIPEDLNNLVLNCLAKNPDERYQTVEELEKDLNKISTNQPVEFRQKQFKDKRVPVAKAKFRVLTLLTWSLTVVVIAGLVTAGIIVYKQKKTSQRGVLGSKGKEETARQTRIKSEESAKQKAEEAKKLEEKRHQEEIKSLLNQIRVYYESKEYQQAIVEANKALVLDPDNSDAKRYISLAQAGLKEIEDTKAQKERHNDYQRWYDKGIEETIDKNYEGAITAFQRALEYEETKEAREKLNEANYEKYHSQGEKAEKEGDLDKAIELYQKSLEYKKEQETGNKIVFLKSRIEDEKKQKEAKERYSTWYKKGEGYEKAGEWEKAKKAYEEALISIPNDQKAKERIAYCQDKLNPTPSEITNSIGMKFVLIKAGTFLMGSPDDEQGRYSDKVQHKVVLTEDFYIQTTEVTQAQYEEIIGKNPSNWKGRDLPVESVSWNDAVAFCKKLSQKEGKEYRLPTEAEWEYACRAGDTGPWSGTGISLEDKAWYSANSGSRTHSVGEKKPNTWGLYDMHGNVWEWCNDWYGEYPGGSVTDPTGPSSGSYRVVRGGSWDGDPENLRSASRDRDKPGSGDLDNGFRCARTP